LNSWHFIFFAESAAQLLTLFKLLLGDIFLCIDQEKRCMNLDKKKSLNETTKKCKETILIFYSQLSLKFTFLQPNFVLESGQTKEIYDCIKHRDI